MTPEEAQTAPYSISTILDFPPEPDYCEYGGPQEWKEECQVDERFKDLGLTRLLFPLPVVETLGRKWPVVQFDNGKILLMTPVYFTHENVRGGIEACRAQVS